jgi:hypothetical protein
LYSIIDPEPSRQQINFAKRLECAAPRRFRFAYKGHELLLAFGLVAKKATRSVALQALRDRDYAARNASNSWVLSFFSVRFLQLRAR